MVTKNLFVSPIYMRKIGSQNIIINMILALKRKKDN